MNLKPISDRIIVLPAKAEEVSTGGIYLPPTAQERPHRGTIIAVGPGRTADDGTLIVPQVKKGDTVMYGKYSGADFTHDEETYIIMRESDIFAIIGAEKKKGGKDAATR